MQQYEGIKIGTYPDSKGNTPETGTVTSVSVNTANGFSGTVSNPTTTPAISIQTSITGILKGNGTAVSAATASDIITSNVLTLAGATIKSTIDGINSNIIDLSPIIPPATTNVLINNGNNTLTSTVNSVSSTDDIITTNTITRTTNAISTQVNGITSTTQPIIDTNTLNRSGSSLTSTVNGVNSSSVTIQPPISSPTNNNLVAMDVSGIVKDAGVSVTTSAASNDNTNVPTTAAVQTNLALKANLASPAFTGTPTAPTATQGDNSTKLATTAYVDTGLATKIDSTTGSAIQKANGTGGLTAAIAGTDYQPIIPAPILDDLVSMTVTGVVKDSGVKVTTSAISSSNAEIMTSAAVQTNLSAKANLASPTFTGAPTAPTPISSDNTTKLATTAFVATAIAGSGAGVSSFAARTGAVIPSSGDYSVAQVTGAAPLASPTFTGTPAAPTQTQGDNSTKLATTAYVDTGLGSKAPLANPAFTGTPTAPTATAGTNTTQIATTAFVTSAITATTNVLSSSTNTMTSVVNGVSSNTPIINSNSLSLSRLNLSTSVNSQASSTQTVCPAPEAPVTSFAYTILTEPIMLLAPANPVAGLTTYGNSSVGTYCLRLVDATDVTKELDIIFTVAVNNGSNYNNSKIKIVDVTDSQGVITPSNLSQYLLFRGFFRSTTPNSYFAVTFSTPYNLIYSGTLTCFINQYGNSFLNENTTLTNLIGLDVNSLITTAAPDLIVKMKVTYTPETNFTPQGYLYFPASGTGAIFQYSIVSLTGALLALTPASVTTTAPFKIATTYLRNYLYNTATGSNNIFMWRISGTAGTISALGTPTIAGPTTPTGIAVDPSDRFVYVCGFGTGQFGQYSITKATGQLVAIASPPTAAAGMQDLVVHPSGKYLYAINSTTNVIYQYSINQTTGALTVLPTATIATGSTPNRIAVHPNGLYLYVLNNGASTISMYTIAPSTGQLTSNGTFTPASTGAMQGLCISPNGLFIYYTSQTAGAVMQSTINLTNGTITTPTTSTAVAGARDCSFNYTGAFIYINNNTTNVIAAYGINTVGALATSIGSVAAGTNGNGINPV
jgi:6-phosphogluconolactonase (cycloisomerase 2 family)